jgi:hypothetical protein
MPDEITITPRRVGAPFERAVIYLIIEADVVVCK